MRTGEDEDPIAVMTVLNTMVHAAAPWARQVRAELLAKCPDAAERDLLAKVCRATAQYAPAGARARWAMHAMIFGGSPPRRQDCARVPPGHEQRARRPLPQAWDSPHTGLIVNERLINCPPQLAPPLLQALLDEVAWATEDEPTQERRESFKFERYIMVTRVYSDPLPAGAGDGAGPSQGAQQQQQRRRQPQQRQDAGSMPPPAPRKRSSPPPGAEPVLVYVRPEDEFMHRAASLSFTFPVEGRAVGRDELTPLRLALLLPAKAAKGARCAALGGADAWGCGGVVACMGLGV